MKWSVICGILLVLMMSCTKQSKTVEEEKEPMQMKNLIVGTYTANESEGIYGLSFDPKNGEIGDKRLLAKTSNPSFLTQSADGQMVYAVNEDEKGMVSSFKWNEDRTGLKLMNQWPTNGMHPCYIDLEETTGSLAIANYSSGNVSFVKLRGDGSLGSNLQVIQHSGKGLTERQEGPHAHCTLFKGDNWLYAVDLGIDQIIAYPVEGNQLSDPHIALELEPGDGPRHLTFHPDQDMAFVINELSNTVVSLKLDGGNGLFEEISRSSTLPEGFTGESYCADIHVSKDGRFLYASNRGHNSIAVFAISAEGELRFLEAESVQGNWPRNFALSPNGEYLLVANQYSNNIVVLRIDKPSGLLSYTGNQVNVSSPVFLGF